MKVRSVERDRSTVPVGRHPRDLVKLLVAAGVVVLCLPAAPAPGVHPVGAAFHLVWGAPGRRTSETVVRRALERAGLTPTEIVTIREHMGAPREFEVTTEAGERLRVEVVDRLHRRGG